MESCSEAYLFFFLLFYVQNLSLLDCFLGLCFFPPLPSGETRGLRTKLLIGNVWKSPGVNENLTLIPNATYHIPLSKIIY